MKKIVIAWIYKKFKHCCFQRFRKFLGTDFLPCLLIKLWQIDFRESGGMRGNHRNILPKVHSSRQVMSTLINNGYTKHRIWPVSEMSPYLHSVLWPAIMIFSLPNLNVISREALDTFYSRQIKVHLSLSSPPTRCWEIQSLSLLEFLAPKFMTVWEKLGIPPSLGWNLERILECRFMLEIHDMVIF